VLALADKPKSGTISLPLEESVIAMTTKEKAFIKRKWLSSGNDELAEYDRTVEVWTSSKHNISKNLPDDLEASLNSSSAKDAPHNGTKGVEDKYWTGT